MTQWISNMVLAILIVLIIRFLWGLSSEATGVPSFVLHLMGNMVAIGLAYSWAQEHNRIGKDDEPQPQDSAQ